MSKILAKVFIDGSKDPSTFTVELTQPINVDQLIQLVYKNVNLDSADFDTTLVRVFDKSNNEYVKAEGSSVVQHLQKFEFFFSRKGHSKTIVTVILPDGALQNLTIDACSITNVKQLGQMLITFLKIDENVSVKKTQVYEEEFEDFSDVSSDAVFDPSRSYRCFLIENIETSEKKMDKNSHDGQNLAPVDNSDKTQIVSHGLQSSPTELNFLEEDAISRQALGRIAGLGELYDAHKDVFVGHSLFCNDLEGYINTTDTEKTAVEYIFEDSINDKFRKFEVEAELKASFLSGMLEASGHGKYLSSSSSNSRESSASLVCRMTTKHERINISNRSLINDLSLDALKNSPSATHVVTAIQWGAGATADLIYKHESSESQENIKASLKFAFDRLLMAIKGSGDGKHNDTTNESYSRFQLKFYVDALPNGEKIPQTVEEAVTFMEKLPKLIENANNGKGVPLAYTLIPISSFKSYLKEMEFYDRIIHKVDESVIEEIVQLFDDLSKSYKMLDKISTEFTEYSYCLKDDILECVEQKLQAVKAAQHNVRKELYQELIEIRHGQKNTAALTTVLQNYRSSDLAPRNVAFYCTTLLKCGEKVFYAQCLAKKNVIYVGKQTSLEVEHRRNDLKEYYGYFCNWANETNRLENADLFIELGENNQKLVFIDLEVNPNIRANVNVPEGNRICHYLNGRYIDTDYLQTWELEQSKCFVRCIEKRQYAKEKPNNRVDIDLPCPQSFKGKFCSKNECEWFCYDCGSRLQYDFKLNYYCNCGFAPINSFQYRCSHERHGNEFVGFDETHIVQLLEKVRSYKEINILLLGETGVGKSTWINGFANYLTYSTLAEAEASDSVCLIPSQFTITDSNYQEKVIKIGDSKNENFATGESCTQEPQSHVFHVGKKTIRIIDTPGIGDTRGVLTDDQNFASILNFISNHKELNGICILLKPNNARMNIVFKYCINGLLAHLDKTASVNIAFCFTNARSTFYRPGDTFPALKKYIDDLQKDKNNEIQIQLGQETIYCLDNEAFRFLCLLHNGEKISEDERTNFDKSWEISVKETRRLLNHFENDVKPHDVTVTLSLNEARTIILTLAKPLADISKNIQQNIKAVARQRDEISSLDAHDVKLREKLMIPHIGIKTEDLGFPRTVCNSINCTETKRLPNTSADQVIYKTICHDHCYISNITPERAPNPAIQACSAINKTTLICKNCNCPWNNHLHITFKQEEVTEMIEDRNVKESLQRNQNAKQAQKLAVENLEKRIEVYKQSQKEIDRIVAKFAAFLKKNAIVPYNDTVQDYLELNIRQEEEQSSKIDNRDLIKQMKEQLAKYQEEKRILDAQLQKGEVQEVKPKEIYELQKELERLPLVGKDIKQLFDATLRGQKTNRTYGEQYYDPYQNHRQTTPRHAQSSKSRGNKHQEKGLWSQAKEKVTSAWNRFYYY